MKVLFSIVLLSLVLWGCSKKNDLTPKISNQTKQLIDTTKKLTRDDSIHLVAFIIDPQKVKTSVSGKTLVLAFDESVNLFLFAEAYKITSAIHLKEDLKKTSLGAFDFTTLNQDGQTTFNFVDDNLNNVKFKSISDTTINHIKVVKINVHRLLTFSKEYGSNQLATDQQNLLLGKTNNQLTFSSYTYYNQKITPLPALLHFYSM